VGLLRAERQQIQHRQHWTRTCPVDLRAAEGFIGIDFSERYERVLSWCCFSFISVPVFHCQFCQRCFKASLLFRVLLDCHFQSFAHMSKMVVVCFSNASFAPSAGPRKTLVYSTSTAIVRVDFLRLSGTSRVICWDILSLMWFVEIYCHFVCKLICFLNFVCQLLCDVVNSLFVKPAFNNKT